MSVLAGLRYGPGEAPHTQSGTVSDAGKPWREGEDSVSEFGCDLPHNRRTSAIGSTLMKLVTEKAGSNYHQVAQDASVFGAW